MGSIGYHVFVCMALLVVVQSHFLDNNNAAGRIPQAESRTELYNSPKPLFGGLGKRNYSNSVNDYSRGINNGLTYRDVYFIP